MSKETSLVAPTSDEIDNIRNFTGENTMSDENMRLQFLKFNGKVDQETSGHFMEDTGEKNEKNKKVYKSIGENLEGVIIRVRKSMQSEMEAQRQMFTKEFDSFQEVLDLFDRNDNRVPVDNGTYQELRTKHPELKLGNVLYVYSANKKEVYKIGVGGGSLSNLWDYLEKFNVKLDNNKKDTVLRYVTKFGSQSAANPKGFEYMQMTFEKNGETPDWKDIWQELKKIDSAISSSAYKKAEILPADESETQEKLPNNGNVITEESINVDDIPF